MKTKSIKEIKKYAKQMGFKSQKEFQSHIEKIRLERSTLKNMPYKYPSLNSRLISRQSNEEDILKFLCPPVLDSSKHSKYIHSYRLEGHYIEYAKSARCRDLHYYNISYYRLGNKVYSKTFFRNKEIKKFRILPKNYKNLTIDHVGLLDNELGELRHGILIRYKQVVINNEIILNKTGISIQLDNPFDSAKKYWEHGLNIKDCLRERDLKIEANKLKLQDEKLKRKARLISKLCNNIKVTFQDSLDSGNCFQGTLAFVKSNIPEKLPTFIDDSKFINDKAIKLSELKKFNDYRVNRIIEYASSMVAQLV